ncbi:amidohydrolase family protein [Sphingomonas aracearum]|nr:amidohydrolase family protein [Sphingomonas aracearum]
MTWIRAAIAAASALAAVAGAATRPDGPVFIQGARVFDGTGAPAQVANVLVRGDRIVAVGPEVKAPWGARVVRARGRTLIPGLHDLHTHLRSPGYNAPEDLGRAYAGYLANGVTTVNDYSVSGEMLGPIREMTDPGFAGPGRLYAPHLQLAVRLGVPGGHGTEFGWGNFFTLEANTPRSAHLMMRRALPYRPDVIKVFTDGWRYGRDADLNSMDEPTLAAIVQDAHRAGLPVITHTVTLEGAKIAARAGVDAVGHGVGDAPIDDELIALMRTHHMAYIATLVVYEPQQDRTFTRGEWQAFNPAVQAREQRRMDDAPDPILPYDAKRWQIMRDNIARLKAAGIRIGVGTDAGIGGVYHGPSTLREITWLTKLGLTPAEALASATSVSADILGQAKDHGRIAVGQRADLVLVDGDPDRDIEALWKVRQVFVAGREVPLDRLRAMIASEDMTALPLHRMAGPIDTVQRADGRTDLDTLPVESTEAGVDHSHLQTVREAAPPPPRIFLAATMGSAPQPFAQLILPLTRGAIQLADARGFTGIAFRARGAGTYRLLLDSYGLQPDRGFSAEFTAGEAAQEIRLPFEGFRSGDASAELRLDRLRAVMFRLSGERGGKAWLELGDVRFY